MNVTPVTAFLQNLTEDLVARAAADGRLATFADVLGAVDGSKVLHDRAEPLDHPSMRYLPSALDSAGGAAGLLEAMRAIADRVPEARE